MYDIVANVARPATTSVPRELPRSDTRNQRSMKSGPADRRSTAGVPTLLLPLVQVKRGYRARRMALEKRRRAAPKDGAPSALHGLSRVRGRGRAARSGGSGR